MSLKKAFLILLVAINIISIYSQEDYIEEPPEMDNIDATYFEEIYYYPAKEIYLAVFKHYFYKGPSQGLQGILSDKVMKSFTVKEILKDGNSIKSENYTIEWINSNKKALLRLEKADFISYQNKANNGYKHYFGEVEYIPDANLKDKLYMYENFFIGYKNEMIMVYSEPIVNGSYGVMDNTKSDAIFFVPPVNLNFWELNSEGFGMYLEKNYEEAISYFQKSLKVNPNYTYTLFNLACTYSLAGKEFSVGKPILQRLIDTTSGNKLEKEKYIEKISTDSDLDAWRNSAEFINWLGRVK